MNQEHKETSQAVTPTVSYTEVKEFCRKHLSASQLVLNFEAPIGAWHPPTARFHVLCAFRRLDDVVECRELQLDADGCVLAERRVSPSRFNELQQKLGML